MWTNLIVMIALLTAPFLLTRAATRDPVRLSHAAAVGGALCFGFTASGHFLIAEQMVAMLPPWVPLRLPLVWATGLVEGAIALALLVPATRRIGAWAAIAVLVLFFPANIYAAFVEAPVGGHGLGPAYLLVRAPVQIFLGVWIFRTLLVGSGRGRSGALYPRPR